MPTLFVIGSYRIMVYPNDHGPAHVHAVGAGHAKFLLGSEPNEVRLFEQEGISARDLRRIAEAIIDRHPECLSGWREFHGDQEPDLTSG